jgi:hypothetical protein
MKDGEKDKRRDIVDRKERKIRKYPGNGHNWEKEGRVFRINSETDTGSAGTAQRWLNERRDLRKKYHH